MNLGSLASGNELTTLNHINIDESKRSRIGVLSQLLNTVKNHIVYYPTPNNLYYVFGLGSLLGIMLIIQVLTGVLLAMHYAPNIELAFDSVERIMREVPSG